MVTVSHKNRKILLLAVFRALKKLPRFNPVPFLFIVTTDHYSVALSRTSNYSMSTNPPIWNFMKKTNSNPTLPLKPVLTISTHKPHNRFNNVLG